MTTPEGLPPEAARLVRGLRELRDRSGLTLAGLAAKTTYSKSSWERYLNGKNLPPRQAVEELCSLVNEPSRRLITLADLATHTRLQPPTPPRTDSAPTPTPSATRRRGPFIAGAVLGCAVITGVGFVLWPAPSLRHPSTQCQNLTCNGKDPASSFCALPTTSATLATYHARGGEQIDIRYSSRCLAAWARVSKSKIGDRIEITAIDGRKYESRVMDHWDAQGYVYTRMAGIGRQHYVHVCLEPATGKKEFFTAHVPRSRGGV